jgi:BolA protein
VRRKQIIEETLGRGLAPTHIEVVDESHRHSVPAGSESHFNLLVVSSAFEGLGRVARHRRIYELLAGELGQGLHALTMTLRTPAEQQAHGAGASVSPPCLGGSKAG